MKLSVIIGLIIWSIFIVLGIGSEFLTCETRKNFFFKIIFFLGGFVLGGIIFSFFGLLGYLILAPIIDFFGINWWFMTIGF